MTLRNRIFALVCAVVFVTVVLTTWTVSASARRAFEAVEVQRTSALVSQFRREFARDSDEVALRVDRIAATDAVRRTAIELARSGADRAAFVNDAAPLAAAHGLDFLDIVASDGTIVSSAEWPARFGYRVSWPIRDRAEQNGAFLMPIELPSETALGVLAMRRLSFGDRTLYLVGGRRLDEQFLASLVMPAGMRVLLYRNLDPELSRHQLVDRNGQVTQAAAFAPLIARVRQSGEQRVETIEWPEGGETVHAIPLNGRDRTVLGVLLIASSGKELAALVSRIRWTGAAFAAVGVALGFVLSYIVAARVTRPVERLAEAARTIAAGNWDVRVAQAGGPVEIGALADAFDAMTRELADQRERLVQAERVAAWRELARRLAHELKNPLFPLRITSDNLRRARTLPAEQFEEVFDESLSAFSTGLNNLNAVVTQFGDFAKMPAPNFARVQPNDIVRGTAMLFRSQLDLPDRPTVTLSVELDDGVGDIRADAEQLRRALQNLLLNAIDAMPRGGELTVRTRALASSVRIDVADTGEGLTEEECKRLFTPYYTTKQHGTGLGLAIVQSIVADHEGRISVESARGRGTTFHLELPA